MELPGIASEVRSVGSSWLLALPLTGYRECVWCQRMDASLPTSGVARRSSSTFQEHVTQCLAPAAALAFIGTQTDLACTHLCDDRADRSVYANVCGERPFSWTYT
jgi:hypothetical protein